MKRQHRFLDRNMSRCRFLGESQRPRVLPAIIGTTRQWHTGCLRNERHSPRSTRVSSRIKPAGHNPGCYKQLKPSAQSPSAPSPAAPSKSESCLKLPTVTRLSVQAEMPEESPPVRCSIMPPITTLPVWSAIASTSTSIAFSKLINQKNRMLHLHCVCHGSVLAPHPNRHFHRPTPTHSWDVPPLGPIRRATTRASS